MAWQDYLIPASYNGAEFHIESGAKAGGRRNVDHEYPKRDIPYAEDMGRRGYKFTIQCYVLGPNYTDDRDALIAAMEAPGPGLLIHPTLGEFLVNPDSYTSQESRLRGNMAELDLTFMEAGSPGNTVGATATPANVQTQAGAAGNAAAGSTDSGLKSAGAGGGGTISA
jgi:prophage DNA circulation protein